VKSLVNPIKLAFSMGPTPQRGFTTNAFIILAIILLLPLFPAGTSPSIGYENHERQKSREDRGEKNARMELWEPILYVHEFNHWKGYQEQNDGLKDTCRHGFGSLFNNPYAESLGFSNQFVCHMHMLLENFPQAEK